MRVDQLLTDRAPVTAAVALPAISETLGALAELKWEPSADMQIFVATRGLLLGRIGAIKFSRFDPPLISDEVFEWQNELSERSVELFRDDTRMLVFDHPVADHMWSRARWARIDRYFGKSQSKLAKIVVGYSICLQTPLWRMVTKALLPFRRPVFPTSVASTPIEGFSYLASLYPGVNAKSAAAFYELALAKHAACFDPLATTKG